MAKSGGAGGGGKGRGGGGSRAWSPSMSAEEADVWARDSVITQPLVHYTSASAAAAIRDEGFDTERSQTNQYFGRGIYLAEAGSGSTFYGDTKLTVRVNVKNPYTYLTDTPPLTSARGPLGKEIADAQAKSPGLTRRDAATQILRARGHDSVIGLEDDTDRIVVVFDRRNVTVVT